MDTGRTRICYEQDSTHVALALDVHRLPLVLYLVVQLPLLLFFRFVVLV
jgi:hypothetical protein